MNKHLSLPLALITSAVLSACTLAPHYQRPDAPVSTTYPNGNAYQTNDAGAGTTAAVDLGWEQFFKDERLKQIIALALKNNRDLRVAALNVAQARAQFRVEQSALFPTLNAVGTDSRARTPADLSIFGRPTTGSTYSAVGSVSWELDFFGRVQSLSKAALETYFATAQARKATEIALVAQVASQYLTVRAADAQLTVTQETLKTANESFRITKLEFDTGTNSEVDLRQAQGVVEQARSNLQAQIRTRAQAENALILLVGSPLPDNLPQAVPLEKQDIVADLPAGLPSDLLMRRPDIIEAEHTLLADNANIGAARAAFFPSISLTSSGGAASSSLGRLLKAGQAYWSFVPTVNVPIFEGGQNVANLDIAKVQKNIAVANYQKAIQTAFREVSDGLAARGTYNEQIDALQHYVYSQQRLLTVAELLYKQGTGDYLNVLTAQTNLYGAQQTLVTAQMERATNLVTLYQALGGGWLRNTGEQPRPADLPPDWDNVDKNGTPVAQKSPPGQG